MFQELNNCVFDVLDKSRSRDYDPAILLAAEELDLIPEMMVALIRTMAGGDPRKFVYKASSADLSERCTDIITELAITDWFWSRAHELFIYLNLMGVDLGCDPTKFLLSRLGVKLYKRLKTSPRHDEIVTVIHSVLNEPEYAEWYSLTA